MALAGQYVTILSEMALFWRSERGAVRGTDIIPLNCNYLLKRDFPFRLLRVFVV